MRTSIIIPCWNALELTRVCLAQVVRWTTRPYELIAIDNGSTDGTGRWLKVFRSKALRRNPRGNLKGFRIISNRANRGYPVAMNQGIGESRGTLLLFGNNDVAATPLWLEGMQEALSSGGGLVGGVSALSNPGRARGSSIAWSCPPWYRDIEGLERYAAVASLGRRGDAFIPVEGFFAGFWFLTSRTVLRRTGSFDERYGPGGYEDLDLQWRMRRAGYRLGFALRSYVHHVGFGCAQMNGLKACELYGPRRADILHRKYPETAEIPFLVPRPARR
jgi:GT2 family glycosyltransferase